MMDVFKMRKAVLLCVVLVLVFTCEVRGGENGENDQGGGENGENDQGGGNNSNSDEQQQSESTTEATTGPGATTIRLFGTQSGTGFSGEVEVYYNGAWGAVCSANWDENDATVACRQLGLIPSGDPLAMGYGHVTGPLSMTNIMCTGTENSLDECSHEGEPQTCATASHAFIDCS
ncbi:neurotrypsin-like [Amphiura filiformis]|uniref:neurotrypsin-like n=1 Tax=Amphiura filiformis TaxID=82378 RepID=UPI003B213047